MTSRPPSPSSKSKLQFPYKLHKMLECAENEGSSSIVSWLPHGKAFQVHQKSRFVEEIMPAYFNSTKYKSFQRNLNLWGFETWSQGPDKGAIYHPCFVRNQPDHCEKMVRQKIKGNGHITAGPNADVAGAPPSRLAASSVGTATPPSSSPASDPFAGTSAGRTATAKPGLSNLGQPEHRRQQLQNNMASPGFTTLSSLFAQAERDAQTSTSTCSVSTAPVSAPMSSLVTLKPSAHVPSPSPSVPVTTRLLESTQLLLQQNEQATRSNFPQIKFEHVQEYERLQREERALKFQLHQNQQSQQRLLEAVAAAACKLEESRPEVDPTKASALEATELVSENKRSNSEMLLGLDAIATAASFVPMAKNDDSPSDSANKRNTDCPNPSYLASNAAALSGISAASTSGSVANSIDPATLAAFYAGADMTVQSFLSSMKNRSNTGSVQS